MVNQYSLKKRLELFGEKAEVATEKELRQIHETDDVLGTKEKGNRGAVLLDFKEKWTDKRIPMCRWK